MTTIQHIHMPGARYVFSICKCTLKGTKASSSSCHNSRCPIYSPPESVQAGFRCPCTSLLESTSDGEASTYSVKASMVAITNLFIRLQCQELGLSGQSYGRLSLSAPGLGKPSSHLIVARVFECMGQCQRFAYHIAWSASMVIAFSF